MDSPGPPPSGAPPTLAPRPAGIRGFLRGPRLADRRGFTFLIAIFVMIIAVFAIAFYGFETTLRPLPSAPIRFTAAYMVGGNGTFNVSSDGNASWPAAGFSLNLSINNFAGVSVPLAPSGVNATFLIGSSSHRDVYHVVWIDRDHDGQVSIGDVFWVTGNGVGLPGLSYCQLGLTWKAGGWTAAEYWVTSPAIV